MSPEPCPVASWPRPDATTREDLARTAAALRAGASQLPPVLRYEDFHEALVEAVPTREGRRSVLRALRVLWFGGPEVGALAVDVQAMSPEALADELERAACP